MVGTYLHCGSHIQEILECVKIIYKLRKEEK